VDCESRVGDSLLFGGRVLAPPSAPPPGDPARWEEEEGPSPPSPPADDSAFMGSLSAGAVRVLTDFFWKRFLGDEQHDALGVGASTASTLGEDASAAAVGG
jgi:hypothetical protein